MSIKKTSLLIFLFAALICFAVVGCASAANVPSANFTSNVTNGTGNLSVQFNDSSTGNPSSWSWNFGDNQTSTEQNPTHNYTSPGNYTVSLTASNAVGNNTIYKTNYIWVYSSAAENRFNNSGFETGTLDGWTSGSTTTLSNTQSHTGGNSVQFSSSGTQETNSIEQNIDLTLVDSISFWGYGENTTNSFYVYIDGKRTSFKAVSNTWIQYTLSTSGYNGVHNITIKWLRGANAYVDDFKTEITKNSANFTSETINNPSEPLTVQFNDTSLGLITSWAWDFDNDGKIDSTLQNPIYTYTKPGNYTVKLTVTGPYYSSVKTLANLFTVVGPINTRTGKVYETIQAAINDSADGDTIWIGNTSYLETYIENVKVNKRVSILAQGKVIVSALNSSNPVFNIITGGSNSVINGFIITGATNSSGIYIAPSISSTITNNTITGNNIGINVDDGSSSIHFNNIYCNTMYGLKFTGNNLDASNNWWGTNKPTYKNGMAATSTVDIYEAQNAKHEVYNPWIVLNVTTNDDLLKNGDNATITVDMTHNSNGQDTSNSSSIPELPVNFNYTLGTLTNTTTTITRGKVNTTLTGGSTSGTNPLRVTVTGCTVTLPITVDTIAPTVNTNLPGGSYNNTQIVALTADDLTAVIYYTTDTTNPKTSNTRIRYTGPITLKNTTALIYVAVDPAGNWSPLYVQNYLFGTQGFANSDWPSFQHDANNTGQSNYTGPQTNTTKWTYGDLTVYGSAVIGTDGTIYVASYDGILYAFNSKGVLLWTWTTRSYILGSPTIGSDGTIYITNWMNSTTYAISSNGTLIWKYTTGDYCTCSPVISTDGTIYIITTNDTNSILYALYPTGILKWTYALGKVYGSSPVIGNDGTIYITDYARLLYAVNTDGTLKWTYTLTGTYYSTLSIGPDGALYIGTRDGILYAINNNGTTKWTYRTYEFMHGAPAISSNGTIYAVGSTKLYAIDSNGKLLWTYTIGEVVGTGLTSAAIGSDGTIYVGSSTGLYALTDNGTNATLKWSYSTGSIAGSPAIASDGTLYIGTINGTFYAFNDRAVNFTIERVNGTALTVQFNGSSTVTPVTSWKWYFGDGTTSTEQKPTHNYTKAGNYTIGLVATLTDGSLIVRPAIVYIEELDITAPTVNISLPSGTYNNTQTITLNATDDRNQTTIYYTTDGSDPITSSSRQVYTDPITIYDSTTLKFVAVDNSRNWCPVSNATYTILHVVYVEDASSYNILTMNTEIQNIIETTPEGYIVVFKGTDYNNLQLVINKQLTLISANGTRIVTSSNGNAVFLINGTQATGTQIIGFTILTNTTNGILINNTNNVIISNVQITADNGIGVRVNQSSNVNVINISVTDSNTGIQVANSNNTQIKNSTFTNNNDGVDVENSTNTTITGTTSSDNTENGFKIYNSSNTTINTATITGNGKTGSNKRSGVYIEGSSNTLITKSQITGNWYGILTNNVINTSISSNSVNYNERDGILLNGNIVNVTILSNYLQYNNNGIQINGAYENLLIQANIITNNQLRDGVNYYYSGDGIVFGGGSNGSSSITITWNIIALNDHRPTETRYGATPLLSNGDTYIKGTNLWELWGCNCVDMYDAEMVMRITRTGASKFTVQFYAGDTLITGLPSFTMTMQSGDTILTILFSDSQGTGTFALSDLTSEVIARAFIASTSLAWDSPVSPKTDIPNGDPGYAAGSMGSGLGDEFGTGINGNGPGTGSGNRPGFATTSGTSGSSGSGSTTGTLAIGATAGASTAGASSMGSPQGSGLSAIGKKIQELITDELKNHSQFWGIITIIVLLIVVILAYYRKSIKSMIEKSKK
nr:PQQ-binding-like beta-propeller repeat protein [uncultured Methanobacterium sp.]